MRPSASLLIAVALVACADDADRATTPAGSLRAASVAIVACNSNLQHQLTLTFAARDREVLFDSATIHGLPSGDADMTLDARVPAGLTSIVRCVSTTQLAPGETSTHAEGTAAVEVALSAGDDSFTAALAAPFSGGAQSWDNCGNVLLPDGCALAAE